MNLLKEKYVIVELIPTSTKRESGVLVQLSALKLDGIQLLDRFDYRLNEDKVPLPDFIDMFSYDKESFTYVDSTEEILEKFKEWIGDLPLLTFDTTYTVRYLEDIPNSKELVFSYLSIPNTEDAIQEMITKYHLVESNYLVDLVYEAIIQEMN